MKDIPHVPKIIKTNLLVKVPVFQIHGYFMRIRIQIVKQLWHRIRIQLWTWMQMQAYTDPDQGYKLKYNFFIFKWK
jgi:hypothetical protein